MERAELEYAGRTQGRKGDVASSSPVTKRMYLHLLHTLLVLSTLLLPYRFIMSLLHCSATATVLQLICHLLWLPPRDQNVWMGMWIWVWTFFIPIVPWLLQCFGRPFCATDARWQRHVPSTTRCEKKGSVQRTISLNYHKLPFVPQSPAVPIL